jgi:Na+-transporting methylmalonyl-CoA/oxaloacetate decarboxylase gamma subunit
MKKILIAMVLLGSSAMMFGQGARNIKINEVLTDNQTSVQDEFGQHLPWLELVNTSFSTYNIRGMFITSDRKVLDKNLTAPQRIALMSPVPNGDNRSSLSARQHLVIFLNSNPAKGFLHLNMKVTPGEPAWIALYDGNGIDLIDSVSVPALAADKSFARIKDGFQQWDVKPAEAVTPGIGNYIEINESKIARLKRDDPHGFGITVLSMGIVFFCLALLYVFFRVFGMIIVHQRGLKKAGQKAATVQPVKVAVKTTEKAVEVAHKTNVVLKDGLHTKGIDREIYMAVIAMALKQYQDDVHDVESGIITIKPRHTMWNHDI